MGSTACTEPQCLYKGNLYLYSKQSPSKTAPNRAHAPFDMAISHNFRWASTLNNDLPFILGVKSHKIKIRREKAKPNQSQLPFADVD